MTPYSLKIMKRLGLSPRFVTEQRKKRLYETGSRKPLTNDRIVADWYEQVVKNRRRLLANTSYGYYYQQK